MAIRTASYGEEKNATTQEQEIDKGKQYRADKGRLGKSIHTILSVLYSII